MPTKHRLNKAARCRAARTVVIVTTQWNGKPFPICHTYSTYEPLQDPEAPPFTTTFLSTGRALDFIAYTDVACPPYPDRIVTPDLSDGAVHDCAEIHIGSIVSSGSARVRPLAITEIQLLSDLAQVSAFKASSTPLPALSAKSHESSAATPRFIIGPNCTSVEDTTTGTKFEIRQDTAQLALQVMLDICRGAHSKKSSLQIYTEFNKRRDADGIPERKPAPLSHLFRYGTVKETYPFFTALVKRAEGRPVLYWLDSADFRQTR